jgi:hypothetical protein
MIGALTRGINPPEEKLPFLAQPQCAREERGGLYSKEIEGAGGAIERGDGMVQEGPACGGRMATVASGGRQRAEEKGESEEAVGNSSRMYLQNIPRVTHHPFRAGGSINSLKKLCT